MSFVFPFAGFRGGFFHSGAALMPLVWALIPIGLDRLSDWTVGKFKWEKRKIGKFFLILVVVYAVFFSGLNVVGKIYGEDIDLAPAWSLEIREYQELEDYLQEIGVKPDDIIMVRNPPGYALVGNKPAVVTPEGGLDTLLAVAQRYQVSFILLSVHHSEGLDDLYNNPQDGESLMYIETINETHIFKVELVP
jgi:hypothetical protein